MVRLVGEWLWGLLAILHPSVEQGVHSVLGVCFVHYNSAMVSEVNHVLSGECCCCVVAGRLRYHVIFGGCGA